MAFIFTWNNTFINQPSDNEDISLGAGRIRDLKSAVTERMIVDHSWAGDAEDGKHLQVTLRVAAADPTIDAGEVTDGIIYTKAVGGASELFFENSTHTLQMTAAGAINLIAIPSGTILSYGGAAAPAGFLMCDGSAVSRTTYASLYAALGGAASPWGQGDGNTTFNVPDLRSRSPVGAGQGAGLSNRALAAKGGEETHLLAAAESGMPAHALGSASGSTSGGQIHVADGGGSNFVGLATPLTVGNVLDTSTTTTVNLPALSVSVNLPNVAAENAAAAHNTMHPFVAVNFMIKT